MNDTATRRRAALDALPGALALTAALYVGAYVVSRMAGTWSTSTAALLAILGVGVLERRVRHAVRASRERAVQGPHA